MVARSGITKQTQPHHPPPQHHHPCSPSHRPCISPSCAAQESPVLDIPSTLSMASSLPSPQSPQSQPASPIFPFLQLPAEVRLTVYRYLIPNLPIYNLPLLRKRIVCLRQDGKRCWPAILRTSHTIYQEVIAEWYSTAQYEVTLDAEYIIFTGRMVAPYVPMPSTILFVETLQLSITLQRGPQHIDGYTNVEHLLNFQDRLTTLARSLSNTQLKRLHLKIAVNIPLLLSLSKTPAEISDLLSWNLEPLQDHIRDLVEMDWELTEQSFGIKNELFQGAYLRMKAIMQTYLDEMRETMMSTALPHKLYPATSDSAKRRLITGYNS